ncbi:MAG: hypothetical protein ABFC54_02925 [Thermoguttaceae bacterium]
MYGRWFNPLVVMLWLSTMGWLLYAKVMPSLLVGEPPNYRRIINAQKHNPPVGWCIALNGRSIGWAISEIQSLPNGLAAVRGWVHFDNLPLQQTMPGWLRTLTQLLGRPIDNLQMDARNDLLIDPLGRLVRFESSIHVDPFNEAIYARGAVDGRQLELVVRAGGVPLTTQVFLPSNAILSDALSPQCELPGLRAGQHWTVPVYSPLWPAGSPLEIVHAVVTGLDTIFWNGDVVSCWLVEYRNDPGDRTAGNSKNGPRGRLWVRFDGAVLRQQMLLFDSTIVFDRMSDIESKTLLQSAGPEWWISEKTARNRTQHD